MSREYEIAFRLGARVNSSLGSAFGRASQNIRGINDRLSRTQREAGAAERAVNMLSSSMKALAAAAVAYAGIRAMKSFADASVEAAKAQIGVETKLEAVLKNVQSLKQEGPQAYKRATEALKTHASELQKLGVIGDEVTLAGMQQLATFQMNDKEIKAVSKGMTNLLAQQSKEDLNVSQQDAVNVANMIGKVMDGQLGALSRVGVSFTEAQAEALKFGDKMTRAKVLAEVLERNVGGANAALAETDQGRVKQMNDAWGDMQEDIGEKILPLQARFAKWFTKKIPMIKNILTGALDKVSGAIGFISKIVGNAGGRFKWVKDVGVTTFNNIKKAVSENRPTLEKVRDLFEQVGTKVKDVLGKAFEAAKPHIEWAITEGLPKVVDFLGSAAEFGLDVYNVIADNWPKIEPIVAGVAGAFLFYKGVTLAAAAVTAIQTGVVAAWNVVAGIGAVVTGAFGVAMAFLTSPLGLVVLAVGAVIAIGVILYRNWDTIKEKAGELWEKIKDNPLLALAAGPIGHVIATGITLYKNFDKIKKTAGELWDKFKEVFPSAAEFIEKVGEKVGGLWDKLKAFWNWLTGGGDDSDSSTSTPTSAGDLRKVDSAGITPHAAGGILTRPHLGLVAEAGPEAIIPLSPSRRGRAIELLQQTSQYLGIIPHAAGGIFGNITRHFNNETIQNINNNITGDSGSSIWEKASEIRVSGGDTIINATYAPVVNMAPGQDTKEIEKVLQKQERSFFDQLNDLKHQQARVAYG